MNAQYPIGQYVPEPFSEGQKKRWLNDLQYLPADLEMAVQNLDAFQLDTPYREGGWTVHEVVHHVADSHMHAYARCKFALTENNPTIMPYNEAAWSELNDVKTLPINVSLTLLNALHLRWHAALTGLNGAQWGMQVYHPGAEKQMTVWYLLGLYVWHGKHHTAHITQLRTTKNW